MRRTIRIVICNSPTKFTVVNSQAKDRLIRTETTEILELRAITKARWEISSPLLINSKWRLSRLRIPKISRKDFGWKLREGSQKDAKVDQERGVVWIGKRKLKGVIVRRRATQQCPMQFSILQANPKMASIQAKSINWACCKLDPKMLRLNNLSSIRMRSEISFQTRKTNWIWFRGLEHT